MNSRQMKQVNEQEKGVCMDLLHDENRIVMKTEGFFIPTEYVSQYRSFFERLLDQAPIGSGINCTLSLIPSLSTFKVSLQVKLSEDEKPDDDIDIEFYDKSLDAAFQNSIKELYNRLRSWRTSRFGDDLSGPTKFTCKPNILIIDDDPFSAKVLDSCFNYLGCSSKKIRNAKTAVEELTENKVIYDLIVLDWTLKEMNGGELIELADFMIGPKTDEEKKMGIKRPVLAYSGMAKRGLPFHTYENFEIVQSIDKRAHFSDLVVHVRKIISDIKLKDNSL